MTYEELLTRGVANIIPNKDLLAKKLELGEKLNIYLGIDPTATHIHLGHAVPLRKLQAFAEMGHNVTFLIGDFTALIGDTSDKDSERPVLTTEQIQENFKTYKSQAEKILDFSKVKVRHNSEWLKDLKFEDIVKLCQHFGVGDFVGRELVKKRLQDNKRVGLHETLYPVMQGYDSYFMDTDIQLGGTDQTFNMQAGRALQKDLRNKESFVMSNGFLTGTDGRKMSKSWGNAVWLDDPADEMYGKVMSLSDDLIIEYFTLGTNTPLEEIEQIKGRLESGEHPMGIKKELAAKIVTELHSEEAAKVAAENFERIVQNKELPSDIKEVKVSEGTIDLAEILVSEGIATSKSEVRRLIEQNGIKIDGETIKSSIISIKDTIIIRVGSRKFLKLVI